MALFDSGINDTLQSLMDILGGVLDLFASAPAPVKSAAVAFLEVVTAMQAIKAIDSKTGLLDSLISGFKYGTVAAREEAEAVAKTNTVMIENSLKNAQARKSALDYVKGSQEKKAAIEAEIAAMKKLATEYNTLLAQYKAGKINATEFIDKVNKLNIAEATQATATKANTVAQKENNAADKEQIVTETVKTATTLKSAIAEKAHTAALNAKTIAQKLANGAMTLGSSILSSLKSPAFIATAAISGLTLV